MSGGFSESGGRQNQSTLSLLPIFLGELFGLQGQSAKGGLRFRPGQKDLDLAPQVFTADDFASIGELTDTFNPVTGDFGGVQRGLDAAQGTFQELLETGGLDTLNQTRRLLLEQDTGDLLEQFGGFGLNANDQSTMMARQRLSETSAASAAEQALQNRAQAASSLGSFNQDVFGTEQLARQAERGRTQGGQLLDLAFGLEGNTQAGGTGFQNSFQAQGGIK